ncbi:uncharacterized protein BYT42DRAFT_563689 [Radiomyces spectabilis]|uniref:uncharacterized protein n=1 Tax=Radiomyces spectabilis TaxID=64574 RepID=UPI00221EA6B6|nr:uncharacterized protein BYT42DRAFT_563689 [Radiomyces spectabilis]KAI8384795.1 hypothetical protein BYT42DRAFT_563689 [Radiomyces spectabilis]
MTHRRGLQQLTWPWSWWAAFVSIVFFFAALADAAETPPNYCFFSYNDTLFFYDGLPEARANQTALIKMETALNRTTPNIHSLSFPFNATDNHVAWADHPGQQIANGSACGVSSDGVAVFFGGHDGSVRFQTYDIYRDYWSNEALKGQPNLTQTDFTYATWHDIIVALDKNSRITYLFHTSNGTWSTIPANERTPLAAQTLVTSGAYVYHLYTDPIKQLNNQYPNHVYAFDPVKQQWIGYIGSFWTTTSALAAGSLGSTTEQQIFVLPLKQPSSSSSFNESPTVYWTLLMHDLSIAHVLVRPLDPSFTPPAAGAATTSFRHLLALYEVTDQGNETRRLTLFDPVANRWQGHFLLHPPEPFPTGSQTRNFWDTDKGYQTKMGIGFGVSVAIGLSVVVCISCRQIRNRLREDRAKKASSPQRSLSFLQRMSKLKDPKIDSNDPEKSISSSTEDAGRWSRRVRRLLTSIIIQHRGQSLSTSPSTASSTTSRPRTLQSTVALASSVLSSRFKEHFVDNPSHSSSAPSLSSSHSVRHPKEISASNAKAVSPKPSSSSHDSVTPLRDALYLGRHPSAEASEPAKE